MRLFGTEQTMLCPYVPTICVSDLNIKNTESLLNNSDFEMGKGLLGFTVSDIEDFMKPVFLLERILEG